MKIGIVRLSSLGDIVHSAIVLQFIKAKFPDSSIDWYIDVRFAQVLEFNPDVNLIPIIDISSLLKLLRNRPRYDIVIDMQGLIKSSLVCSFLRGTKIGFSFTSAKEGIASIFYDKRVKIEYEEHIIKRNISLIKEALSIEVEDFKSKKPFLFFKEKTEIDFKDKSILFIIGASKANKIYPKEKFVELANILNRYKVFIPYKSNIEYENGLFILKNTKNTTLLEEMNLDKLKSFISKVDLVIGCDSGPTHMAWGLNKPSITLFGNTPLERFCLNSEINFCLKGEDKIKKTKHIDKSDFTISNIKVDDIANLAFKILQ